MMSMADALTNRPDENLLQAIRSELHRLPPQDRQIIALHFGACLPCEEIGDSLELPRESIVNRLGAAIAALRERLADSGFAGFISDDSMACALTSGKSAPKGLYEKVQQRISATLNAVNGMRGGPSVAGSCAILLTCNCEPFFPLNSFGPLCIEETCSCNLPSPISITTAHSHETSGWSASRSRIV